MDEEEFIEIEIDVKDIISKEELVEKINNLETRNNQYIKIILKGNRNFELNTYEIIKLVENEKIIKIKNKTNIAYNLEQISNSNTLKGIFVQKMLEKLKQDNLTEENKMEIEKAIEVGLEALE